MSLTFKSQKYILQQSALTLRNSQYGNISFLLIVSHVVLFPFQHTHFTLIPESQDWIHCFSRDPCKLFHHGSCSQQFQPPPTPWRQGRRGPPKKDTTQKGNSCASFTALLTSPDALRLEKKRNPGRGERIIIGYCILRSYQFDSKASTEKNNGQWDYRGGWVGEVSLQVFKPFLSAYLLYYICSMILNNVNIKEEYSIVAI